MNLEQYVTKEKCERLKQLKKLKIICDGCHKPFENRRLYIEHLEQEHIRIYSQTWQIIGDLEN